MLFNSSLHLHTASTDGHVVTWDLSALLSSLLSFKDGRLLLHSSVYSITGPERMGWQLRYRAHQSSVKSMVTLQLTKSDFVTITGGDDNSLAIALVSLRAGHPSEAPTSSILLIPHAHASAITALAISQRKAASEGMRLEFHILSSGNDQRLKLWSVRIDLSKPGVEGIEISKAASVHSGVADISSMDIVEDGDGSHKVLLCGEGMEVWTINID